MQTQNYVYYMHFFGFEGIRAKVRARAFCEKNATFL